MNPKDMTFGRFVKEIRMELGLTLREFCRDNELDSVAISKIERDVEIPSWKLSYQEVISLANALQLSDIEENQLLDLAFSQFVKQKRMELGLTLRKFCNENGLDSAVISRIERGIGDPSCLLCYDDAIDLARALRLNETEEKQYMSLVCFSDELKESYQTGDEKELSFGKFVKQKRMQLGLRLREFCRKHGFNPSVMSMIERDIAVPMCFDYMISILARALDPKVDIYNKLCELYHMSSSKTKMDIYAKEGWQQDLKDSYQMGFEKDVTHGTGKLDDSLLPLEERGDDGYDNYDEDDYYKYGGLVSKR